MCNHTQSACWFCTQSTWVTAQLQIQGSFFLQLIMYVPLCCHYHLCVISVSPRRADFTDEETEKEEKSWRNVVNPQTGRSIPLSFLLSLISETGLVSLVCLFVFSPSNCFYGIMMMYNRGSKQPRSRFNSFISSLQTQMWESENRKWWCRIIQSWNTVLL